jgi:capsular polysaccharide biosynthesis protein
MTQNNLQSNTPLNQGDEISLLDVMLFLRRFWVIISVTGFIGLVASLAYDLITPKQYEAIAQIQIAQIRTASNINSNPLGINIEEPSMLIARLSIPTAFTPSTITACGLDGRENAPSILVKSIKLSQPKGAPTVVEIKIIGSNPDVLHKCANAIFGLVKTFQDQLVAPYIVEANIKLTNNKIRLDSAKDFILKADKSGSVIGAAYLSNRDEIRYLLDEIATLQDIIASDTSRETRLVAPIYVGEVPISPKKQVTLSVGLLGGIFLGLLIALLYQIICKFRAQRII